MKAKQTLDAFMGKVKFATVDQMAEHLKGGIEKGKPKHKANLYVSNGNVVPLINMMGQWLYCTHNYRADLQNRNNTANKGEK